MATDFTYGGKQIVIGGPIKPNGKDMPSDARTRAVGPYLQIPFRIVYSSKPFSFRINSLQVLINGIEQPIINLGGYYVEETFTLE